MCLLFLQKNNTRVFTRTEFNEAWSWNKDWFWLYIADEYNNVDIFKTKDREIAWNKYYEAISNPYALLIWHFRLWTHWPNSEKLIHPFNLNKDTHLFHNWILSLTADEWESDTSTLANFYNRANTKTKDIFTTTFVEIMEKIGWTWNKFVVANGKYFFIINELAWFWEWDSWYSNDWFRPYKHYYLEKEIIDIDDTKKKEIEGILEEEKDTSTILSELDDYYQEMAERDIANSWDYLRNGYNI